MRRSKNVFLSLIIREVELTDRSRNGIGTYMVLYNNTLGHRHMKPRSFLRDLRCFSFSHPVKMHRQQNQGPSLKRELQELIKQRKNEELKCMLEGTKPSDWVFDNGTTLLHLAVAHDNRDLIKYLLDIGHDIEAKNSNGDTTLLIALNSHRLEAAKILVDADANVCVIDSSSGQRSLGVLMTRYFGEYVEGAVPHFLDNLKRRNLDADTLVELFLSANWRLDFVMSMNDLEVNRKFLKRDPLGNHHRAMIVAIQQRDLDNIKLILRYGNNHDRKLFYEKLSEFYEKYQMDSWKFFIENLSYLDAITEWSLHLFDFMFMSTSTEYLQVLLDFEIHTKIRQKFGIDLQTCIFGNKRVDAVELHLRNQDLLEDFNINARSLERQTALHYAVKENLMYNIRFLLNSGADVNAKNDEGRTALFDCMHRNNNGQLLLEYGADVQVIDDEGITVFELAQRQNPVLLDFLIAQLAINHDQGVPIKPVIKNQIDFNDDYRRTYETCYQQLQLLKACEISNSITLFTVLTTKFETPYRFSCDQNTIFLLDQHREHHGLHLFYYRTIKEKMIKISNLYQFSCDVSDIISEGTGKFIDFDHLVIKKISDYFTQKDLEEYIISVTTCDV